MTTTMAPAAVSQIDPFSDDFLTDPYDGLESLRDAGAAVWLRSYGVWAVARFEDVTRGLSDHAAFCSSAGVGLSDFRKEKPWRPPSLLLEADPPDHTMARAVVTDVLTPKVVRELREAFLDTARLLVSRLVARGEVDGVNDLAKEFPLSVFPDLVGLPRDGRENLLPYGAMVFNGFGPQNAHFEAAMAKAAVVTHWIMKHCSASELAPGGLGAQIHESAAAAGYSPDDASRIVRSFLSAGVDTTVHGIGNAVWSLATHPDQWELLKATPKLARAAFEEAIRFESPVQTFFRTSTGPDAFGDQEIGAGQKVLFFLGSANRDPRRWEAPTSFDITRRAAGHVGFGVGVHACIGQMLARMEGECVLTALAEQVDQLRISGPAVRQLNNTLRGFDSIPLTITGH